MTEEEIKKMQEENAKLKADNATLATERDTLKNDNTKLTGDIVEKDKIIEQKTKDIVGARQQYKKLSDMTQAEKDQLSKAELELKQRQEELEAQTAEFQKKQIEENQKQVTARRDAVISKMAGGKPEIIAKMKENWSKIDKGITEKATTDDEIAKIATDAYNMLGSIKPAEVNKVVSGAGNGEAGDGTKQDFTDTPEGKALAGALNIDLTPPTEKK